MLQIFKMIEGVRFFGYDTAQDSHASKEKALASLNQKNTSLRGSQKYITMT